MRWTNFLSQLNFHIAHILGKQNLVADALSRRPMVNAISNAHHHDLIDMINEYVHDEDYANILANLSNDIPHETYSLKEGF